MPDPGYCYYATLKTRGLALRLSDLATVTQLRSKRAGVPAQRPGSFPHHRLPFLRIAVSYCFGMETTLRVFSA